MTPLICLYSVNPDTRYSWCQLLLKDAYSKLQIQQQSQFLSVFLHL
jgi:hypothetical protein